MSSKAGRRRIMISIVVLAVASAVAWAIILASRPMSADMPGMDHGSEAMPESTPIPSMAEDMPGMDHGSADAPEPGHGAGDIVEAASDRPLAPVLGAFGGGTAVVLLTAGMMRRKDRAADHVKQAARAPRRNQK